MSEKHSLDEHKAELARIILAGGEIYSKNGHEVLTIEDFQGYAENWFETPTDALKELTLVYTSEEGESDIKFMELMFEAITKCALEFIEYSISDATEWSIYQEECYDVHELR